MIDNLISSAFGTSEERKAKRLRDRVVEKQKELDAIGIKNRKTRKLIMKEFIREAQL